MQLRFAEIDKKVQTYMKQLQDTRNPDPLSWTEDIRAKIDGAGSSTGFLSDYKNVCAIDRYRLCATTSDAFPEATCADRAEMKALAWKNMGYILA